MSEPTPGVDPGVNPKAAAKAAKAYAKASRPWYRKKRWWLLAAVAVIAVIASATSGGGGPEQQVEDAGTVASGNSTTRVPTKGPSTDDPKSDSSFKGGVLITPDVRIEITDHKVIKQGQKGNEYGDKPVLAVWYKITNISGKKVDPTEFIWDISAYQDNNPNRENKLDVGTDPDDRLSGSSLDNIKKGGTVESAIAYELDDLTTPVDLVASDDLGFSTIGKVRYQLN